MAVVLSESEIGADVSDLSETGVVLIKVLDVIETVGCEDDVPGIGAFSNEFREFSSLAVSPGVESGFGGGNEGVKVALLFNGGCIAGSLISSFVGSKCGGLGIDNSFKSVNCVLETSIEGGVLGGAVSISLSSCGIHGGFEV